jgi:hypothetical protein
MLAAALILAGLFLGAPKETHTSPDAATCPATPETAFVAGATTCPALEVSGFAGGTGVSLDPAFDVSIAPAELARPTQNASAVLAGYAADGRRLFILPIAGNGAFHLYVPLAPAAQQILARIEVSTSGARAERIASAPADAVAEIISLDEGKAIVAWNARAFPSIRIKERTERPAIAVGSGSSTYEQMSVDTRARLVFIEFSDGVHSTTRAFAIFGRQ